MFWRKLNFIFYLKANSVGGLCVHSNDCKNGNCVSGNCTGNQNAYF